MATPFKIIISPDGDSIVTVYTEKLGLEKLGTPTVFRATEVEFDNVMGDWKVNGIPPLFEKKILLKAEFEKRSNAIAWEIEYLCKNMEELNARIIIFRDKEWPREHKKVAA